MTLVECWNYRSVQGALSDFLSDKIVEILNQVPNTIYVNSTVYTQSQSERRAVRRNNIMAKGDYFHTK